MAQPLRNFVNGKYTDPRDGAYSDVVDPSTGETYTQAPVSRAADVDEALNVAATAFETWRDATPAERSLAMLRFADAVEKRRADHPEPTCCGTAAGIWAAADDATRWRHRHGGASPAPGVARTSRRASRGSGLLVVLAWHEHDRRR